MPKTMNWSKLYEVQQEKKESPTAFLERLKEVARKYTDLQIDTEQAKVQLALIFLGQSQDDIRRKLQKLEGEELRNLDKLLEVAWKVYINREREASKRQQQNLLAVIQGKGNANFRGCGRSSLGRRPVMQGLSLNQCVYCKQEGHWKRECPNLNNQFHQGNQFQQENVAKAMVLGEYSS